MARVDLQNRQRDRHRLPGGLEDPPEMRADAVLVADQACRRVGQPVCETHVTGAIGKSRAHPLDEPRRLVCRRCPLRFLRRPAAELAQIEPALGDRPQRLAVEFGQQRHDPFVNRIVHQQDFDAELPEDLQVRAVARGRECVGSDEIDGVLPVPHAADILGERDRLRVALASRRRKPQQLRDPLAVRGILDDPFLEHAAERRPERGVPIGMIAARSSSSVRTRFTDAARMVCTSRDCCRISRETLSGRSFESMMPRTKRRYIGISCSASSMMNTRRI